MCISHISLTGAGSESLSMTILFTSENHIGRSDITSLECCDQVLRKGKMKAGRPSVRLKFRKSCGSGGCFSKVPVTFRARKVV